MRELQEAGETVAMVGDGHQTTPPRLLAPDVGLAIGTGRRTLPKEGADVVLMHSDLMDVARAIELSRGVMRNIKQDLFWALFYNACGNSRKAAGVFFPDSGLAALAHVWRRGNEPLKRVCGYKRAQAAWV